MKRIIGFATGSIWRWSNNINDLLSYAKRLGVTGIEITFASKEELFSCHLSQDNQSWLRYLDYVSIHAPFRLMRESENEEEVIKQLDIISKLSDNINAENVIIHPDDLPEPETLKKYRFNVSTENLPPGSNIMINDLREILSKYREIRLCLDVSHAFLCSKYETGKLIGDFKNRISQIHLSGTYQGKDHQSIRDVTEEFLFSIKPLKTLNTPLVIEEDIHFKDMGYLKEEIEYIKRFFH